MNPDLPEDGDSAENEKIGEILSHREWLIRFLMGLVYSRSAAEDLADEIISELSLGPVSKIHRIKPYLTTVAKNKALNYRRNRLLHRKKHEEIAAKLGFHELDDSVARTEIQSLIFEKLLDLPDIHKLPLILHYVDQEDLRDVAEKLDISYDNARKRIERGLKAVRKQLKEHYGKDWKDLMRGVFGLPILPIPYALEKLIRHLYLSSGALLVAIASVAYMLLNVTKSQSEVPENALVVESASIPIVAPDFPTPESSGAQRDSVGSRSPSSGRVLDYPSNRGVRDATVFAKSMGLQSSTTTAADGSFELIWEHEKWSSFNGRFFAEKPGYVTTTKSIETLPADFILYVANTGTIVDVAVTTDRDSALIPQVEIFFLGQGWSSTGQTDLSGRVSFVAPVAGEYSIRVSGENQWLMKQPEHRFRVEKGEDRLSVAYRLSVPPPRLRLKFVNQHEETISSEVQLLKVPASSTTSLAEGVPRWVAILQADNFLEVSIDPLNPGARDSILAWAEGYWPQEIIPDAGFYEIQEITLKPMENVEIQFVNGSELLTNTQVDWNYRLFYYQSEPSTRPLYSGQTIMGQAVTDSQGRVGIPRTLPGMLGLNLSLSLRSESIEFGGYRTRLLQGNPVIVQLKPQTKTTELRFQSENVSSIAGAEIQVFWDYQDEAPEFQRAVSGRPLATALEEPTQWGIRQRLDAEGRVRVEHPAYADLEWRLYANHAEYSGWISTAGLPQEGGQVSVTLPSGSWVFHGTVTDLTKFPPKEEYTVQVRPLSRGRLSDGQVRYSVRQSITDEGRFELRNLPAQPFSFTVIRPDGSTAYREEIQSVSGERHSVVLEEVRSIKVSMHPFENQELNSSMRVELWSDNGKRNEVRSANYLPQFLISDIDLRKDAWLVIRKPGFATWSARIKELSFDGISVSLQRAKSAEYDLSARWADVRPDDVFRFESAPDPHNPLHTSIEFDSANRKLILTDAPRGELRILQTRADGTSIMPIIRFVNR